MYTVVATFFVQYSFNPFPNNKFWTLPKQKRLQRTISNLMKMVERIPKVQKTLLEKEELLVMSNFSFSHSVLKILLLQTRKNQGLFGKGLKLLRMFALVISWMSLKIGHVESKSRSLGQILEKPCVRCRGHIFSLIVLKFSKNVCPNDILDQFENVLCWLKN